MIVTYEQLQQAWQNHKGTYGGRAPDYFCALFMADKFEIPLPKILPYVLIGKNQLGIDGYYIDKSTRNLYLYICAWSENYESLKEKYRDLIREGIEQIFTHEHDAENDIQVINRLRLDLQEYSSIIDKVFICLVFNGDPAEAENSRVFDSMREELESKKHIIDTFFDNSGVALTIQYISNATKKINQTSRTKKSYQYDIGFESQEVIDAANGESLSLGFINLYDLYRMYSDMKLRLFEKNIRAGLSDDLAPNQAIRRMLKEIVIHKKTAPEYFTFHHNGITLYAEKFSKTGAKTTIVEPRVLNGAQTITTFARFIDENKKLPDFGENEDLLKEIRVIGKVITNCESEFITQVTISNNKQNPVESWNLRANDYIQLEFDDKFRKDGIFYERQENSFAGLSQTEFEEMGVQDKEIKIKKLAQTFLAFQGEVDKISDISKVFDNDNVYEKTFRNEYLKADTAKLLLGYKIQFRLGAIQKEIISKGENKYTFIRFARNLLWSLTLQAMLNDDQFDNLKEQYGKSLSMESGYTEYLKSLGSRKVRLIISELIQLEKYQAFMLEEKYGFLKTKVVFTEAMKIARERYGWETQGL